MQDSIYYEGSRREFIELAAQIDVPAFIRRGLHVQDTVNSLIAGCAVHRHELLEFPRWRLGALAAMINQDWSRLEQIIGVESAKYLAEQYAQWQPELRVPVARTDSTKRIRRAIRDVAKSFEKFNRKWESYVADVSLADVNDAREQYNKYYVCEKAAAFQSERIGQDGFEELPQYELTDLMKELPCLDAPQVRE